MIADTSHNPTEQTERSFQSSSQSHSFGKENNGRQPRKKQLDLDGIRELIL